MSSTLTTAMPRAFPVEMQTSQNTLCLKLFPLLLSLCFFLFVYSNKQHFKISFALGHFNFYRTAQRRDLGALCEATVCFSRLHGAAVSCRIIRRLFERSVSQLTPWRRLCLWGNDFRLPMSGVFEKFLLSFQSLLPKGKSVLFLK